MFRFIGILIVAIFIGVFLQKSSQYISFTYNSALIQIPLWAVIATIVAFIFMQYWLLQVACREWLKIKRINKTIKYAKQAFYSLMAGQSQLAERYALKMNNRTKLGWVGFLLAAKAAKEQFAWDRCYEYISKAEILAQLSLDQISFWDAKETAAFGLLKAEIYYNQGEYKHSLMELTKLYKQFPRHKPVLLQLAAVYQTLADWQGLIKFLPILKKQNVYNTFDYQQLEFKAYRQRLEELTNLGPIEEVLCFFKDLPKVIKQNSQFIVVYVNCLLHFKCYDIAEKTIRNNLQHTLPTNWNLDLIRLYGLIKSSNIKQQIKLAETWLSIMPKDPTLLLTLGRLCIKESLFGKAKNYLELAITLKADPACYAELGRLASLLGESEKSFSYYQTGLLGVIETVEL